MVGSLGNFDINNSIENLVPVNENPAVKKFIKAVEERLKQNPDLLPNNWKQLLSNPVRAKSSQDLKTIVEMLRNYRNTPGIPFSSDLISQTLKIATQAKILEKQEKKEKETKALDSNKSEKRGERPATLNPQNRTSSRPPVSWVARFLNFGGKKRFLEDGELDKLVNSLKNLQVFNFDENGVGEGLGGRKITESSTKQILSQIEMPQGYQKKEGDWEKLKILFSNLYEGNYVVDGGENGNSGDNAVIAGDANKVALALSNYLGQENFYSESRSLKIMRKRGGEIDLFKKNPTEKQRGNEKNNFFPSNVADIIGSKINEGF